MLAVRFDVNGNMEILGRTHYHFSSTFDDKGILWFGGKKTILFVERPDLLKGVPASASALERDALEFIVPQYTALHARCWV